MPTPSQSQAGATRAVNLRVRSETRSLIDHAAQLQGRSRSDFMIETSRRAAEDAILDQTVFNVDAERYDRFVRALEATPAANERLRKTMRTPGPWDAVERDAR